MNLRETFEFLLQSWAPIFSQTRVWQRVHRLTLGLLFCLRTHLISTAICACGRQFRDWSADYRVFSRSRWNSVRLFAPIWDHLSSLLASPTAPVLIAIDDTTCKKTGRHIPGVSVVRDPQSPKGHVNLRLALRFLQISVLVHPRPTPGPARALPVRFDLAPPAKKPKKKASPEEWKAYRQQQKLQALPRVGAQMLADIRREMDRRPDLRDRILIAVGDGSYTNRTLFQQGLPPRTLYIGRIRKDAKLCAPLPPASGTGRGRRRQYGPPLPTPEQIRRHDSIPWRRVQAFVGGQMREIQVKVLGPVYWRKAGAHSPLQLVVIKACGYRLRKGAKLLYRDPAFLICTDPALDLQTLVQAYLYRWEIECNHRDEKSLLGVAQGQVRSIGAVARLPVLQVASYSLLLLASLLSGGFQRGPEYLPLPKWRNKSIRPSLLDLLNLLRDQTFAQAMPTVPLPNIDHFASAVSPLAKSPKIPMSADILCTEAA
jgi:hypothetical protein